MRIGLAGLVGGLAAVILAWPDAGLAKTYLRLEGVDGKSTVAGQTGWIEIQSYKMDRESPADSASGHPSGKRPASVTITKLTDSASPALFHAHAAAQSFAAALIDVVDPTGALTTTFKFEKVLISSYEAAGANSLETMIMTFETVEMTDVAAHAAPSPTNGTGSSTSPWAN